MAFLPRDSQRQYASGGGLRLGDGFQQLEQLRMEHFVGSQHIASFQHTLTALKIRHHALRLSYHENTGGHIPLREAMLPEGVESAGCNPREIKRRRTEPTNAWRRVH